jgi:murein DD-endopeptidase MepM/ murein hydrolase activator NlpD
MRLAPLVLSIAILGIPRNLEAARPARRAVHASSTVHKVRRGETAAKVARDYRLSLEELAALNPKVNLARLSVGTPLKVKGRLEPKPVQAAAEKVQAEPSPVQAASVMPVPPIPAIRANGPAVLVHLERLLPTNTEAVPASPVKKTTRVIPPMTSQDLVPIFPSTAGLEYESAVAADLGFEPADPNKLDFLWPVGTRSISSAWGPRMRTRTVRVVKANRLRKVKVKYQGSHKGVDLTAPMGADVYAAQDGRIVFSGKDRGYGNCVFIDHGNGVETRYAHHRANFVHEGDLVRRGQKIAEVGTTGHSTGPHLHFEFRMNGESLNPLPVLNDVEDLPAEMVAFNETIKGHLR